MSPSEAGNAGVAPVRLNWLVFFVSAGVLGYEVGLMRMLLVASWHHFAFLVISLALLGFGASGTLLSLARSRLLPRAGRTLDLLVAVTALSMPVCAAVAQQIPVEARIVPVLLWSQLGWWLLYWIVIAVPFLAGAAAVGLALMAAPRTVGTVYASNLAGSAVGAAAVTVTMFFVAPPWLPAVTGGMALIGLLDAPWSAAGRRRLASAAGIALVVAVWLGLAPPEIRSDPYKYASHLDRLAEQGSARRVATAYSSRAAVGVWRSDLFHDLPFLGVGRTPPPMDSLVLDGHHAGSLLRVDGAEAAAAVGHTLMAVPYDLVGGRPAVALLGEADGVNTWIGIRAGADPIAVVQPDETLLGLLRGPLADGAGKVFDAAAVEVHTTESRHFVEHETAAGFDLVQLVSLQSLGGGGGVAGLAENHLVTVEGVAACLRRLRPDGVLAACRGIETPPRDNVKLLATAAAALERFGAADPGRHVVVVRDYLGVCTFVRPEPWSDGDVAGVRRLLDERQLTPVWFPGIRPDELNRPDQLPGPEDGPGDWYHHAASELFSPRASEFIDDYVYDIRPPTDARPFFEDFTRLGSLGAFRRAFGDLWLTRTELAFLFVLVAAGAVAVVGFAATVLPLLLQRRVRRAPRRAVTGGYFTCLGLGYLLLEMTLLSRVTYLVGDPVTAASVVLAAFLLLSGVGSAAAQRLDAGRSHWVPLAVAGIVAVTAAQLMVADPVAGWVGTASLAVRCAAAVLLIAPLAVLMGFPMPLGLARLHRGTSVLVPLAWGVNGFASVLASPLAILLAMTWSYHVTAAVAVAAYLFAAVLFRRLPS